MTAPLPELPKLPEIPQNILDALNKIKSYEEQLIEINANLSLGGQLKNKIVDSVVPELSFNLPCKDFENKIPPIIQLIIAYLQALKFPVLPEIPLALKALLGLQVGIKIEIPTIADFIQAINLNLELKKKNCQEAIIKKQIEDARKERKPFTARKNDIALRSKPTAVANRVLGAGKSPAYVPTEDDLRILEEINNKCCENCT